MSAIPAVPSFFATLSLWWIATIVAVSLMLIAYAAKEAADTIDDGKIAAAEETMTVISALAKDMNRAKPHEFVARMVETGQFKRIGVYCAMADANFEGTPDGITKGGLPNSLATQSMSQMSQVSQVSSDEIRLSRPLHNPDGTVNGALYMVVDRAQTGQVIWSLLSELWLFVGLIVTAVGAGAVMLARKVSRPVAALTASTSRIAGGDLDTAIETDGPAEIQTLSTSISSMVSNLKSNMNEINRMAYTDALTKLPNRAGFLRDGDETVREKRADTATATAVLFIDLDGFKAINDTHGHEMGDKTLRYFADRLDATLRQGDRVLHGHAGGETGAGGPAALPARLGGDEFTVLLTGINDAAGAVVAARRILQIVAAPIRLDGAVLDLGASIGIAVADAGEADFETLLNQADEAMYDVKRSGRNNFKVYGAVADDGGQALKLAG